MAAPELSSTHWGTMEDGSSFAAKQLTLAPSTLNDLKAWRLWESELPNPIKK